jgi:ABC-type transporter Mla maintaining outer membrane lipid asymmetry ATPase subunit MlaF
LVVEAGERVSIANLDAQAAETLVNLVTGATLPDEGTVEIFGRASGDISDSSEWLNLLDRFGLVTDRIVLLDSLTVAQNLAVPFTLELDPLSASVLSRVEELALETGLKTVLGHPVAEVPAELRARVRLSRALALNPDLLLLEHATATLSRVEITALAKLIVQILDVRRCALVAITADQQFARALGGRQMVLHLGTGVLHRFSRWSWR